MDVYVNGRRVRLDPRMSIGKGGEADVYDIGHGLALKHFKRANHPDFRGMSGAQRAALERLLEHQKKLPAFPQNLTSRVVAPQEMATNRDGSEIHGYTMHLVRNADELYRYGTRTFRDGVIDDKSVVGVLADLHTTLRGLHAADVVVGDFNDLNVLVRGAEAFLVDADSFQFGPYLCRMFTEKFVDPLLCGDQITLVRPHTALSDWYAFTVMLMQVLLYTWPYGGVHRPRAGSRLTPRERREGRVTVFDPDVLYPRPARHYGILPDDLLQHLHKVFVKDKREAFPRALLEEMEWQLCNTCGLTHARSHCPSCQKAYPEQITTVVSATVSAEKLYSTSGRIVRVDATGGELIWLTHKDGGFMRETGVVVTHDSVQAGMRFRLLGERTLIAHDHRALLYGPRGDTLQEFSVDTFGRLPLVDTNAFSVYWLYGGDLKRTDALGPDYPVRIGGALANQTLFWVGPIFGVGFYRAGELTRTFTFNTRNSGLNFSINLHPVSGELVHASCIFSSEYAWLYVSSLEQGMSRERCHVITRGGSHVATVEADDEDGAWVSGVSEAYAFGSFLLVPTDEGIVRVRVLGPRAFVEATYPETQRFVHGGRRLIGVEGGLAVVGSQEIWRLKLTKHT